MTRVMKEGELDEFIAFLFFLKTKENARFHFSSASVRC